MTGFIVPSLLLFCAVYAACKGVDVFSAMTAGAKRGLGVIADILPSLVVALTAIYMFRVSGAVEFISRLCSPLLNMLGIPRELASLMLTRPLSGSAALAAGSEIMSTYGPDSFIGRCAAVMLGSTETTFYVIAVYFAASGTKNIRRIVPAALAADMAGFIVSVITVRLFT